MASRSYRFGFYQAPWICCFGSRFGQKKNTVNILFKTVMIIPIRLITYYLVGFNLMIQ